MSRTSLVALAGVLAFSSLSVAHAGCDFEHPRKAKLFQAEFVQAFVSCGAILSGPNTTTAGGVPGCAPPETLNQQAGSPTNGWQWLEDRSTGLISLRETQCQLTLPNCRNVKLKFKLRRIIDGTGALANGSGRLLVLARITLEDPVSSAPSMGTDVTIVDVPVLFTVVMTNGNGTLATALFPQGVVNTSLPGCTSIEVLDVAVIDPNGNTFARPGVFLADLPN